MEENESTPDISTPEGVDQVADDIADDPSLASSVEEDDAPQDDAEAPQAKPDKTPAAAPSTAPATGEAPECPSSLTGKIREQWASLPPDVQGEFVKREQDFAQYYEQTREPVEISQGVEKIVAPYQQIFERYGVNPFNHIESLLAAHTTLLFGNPQQKHHLALALLQDAGIDPTSLAQGQIAPLDERYDELRRSNAELNAKLARVSGAVTETEITRLEGQIMTFAEAKNTDGTPAHPYFWDVHQELQDLFRRNPGMTLDAAYQEAIWANPVVRVKELDRAANERAGAIRKADQTRTRSARRGTAVNVQGTASGRPTSDSGDWEKDLPNILSEIQGR